MSSSSLSLTKAKEIAINFIKKYKGLLCDGHTCQRVTDSDIARYEAKTPSDFFENVNVQAIFGHNYDLFAIRQISNSKQALIWMGEHTNINDLTKKITKNSESIVDLLDFWQMKGTWYILTEARMEALEKIFDQLCNNTPKTKTAKKSGKKVAKKPEVVTISDTTEVQNGIAFIDFEADKFEHQSLRLPDGIVRHVLHRVRPRDDLVVPLQVARMECPRDLG